MNRELSDKEWCAIWMTGFMAALFLNAQGGKGPDWLALRDEYLAKRNS